MGLLSNDELHKFVSNGGLSYPAGAATWEVKGASIDLSVGDIFVPSAKIGDKVSVDEASDEITLREGETAVIRTREKLRVDLNHAGIAFPAARVSLKGLLMTNPGHIDPGYDGELHVTVINMGREPFSLRRGDRLMRCLIFRLDAPATVPMGSIGKAITQALLRRLSPDFLSVRARAGEEVRRAELRITARQAVIPVVVAIIGAIVTVLSSQGLVRDRLAKVEAATPNAPLIEARLGKLESMLPIEQRMDALEGATIRDIDERLRKIETATKSRR